MAGITTNTNPSRDRARKIASATPAQREAARQDYVRYAAANRAMDATPEPFERYFSEWLDVRKMPAEADAGPVEYEKRDYSALYRSGEKWT